MGGHGDRVRLLAGGRQVASQIQYIKKYGSAHPVVDTEHGEMTIARYDEMAEAMSGNEDMRNEENEIQQEIEGEIRHCQEALEEECADPVDPVDHTDANLDSGAGSLASYPQEDLPHSDEVFDKKDMSNVYDASEVTGGGSAPVGEPRDDVNAD